MEDLSLFHQEKIHFMKTPNFEKNTQTAQQLPKVDIFEKWS